MMKGRIIAVCTSKNKGTRKQPGDSGFLQANYGLLGDAHAAPDIPRQVSLLSTSSLEKMRALGLGVGPGDFAENLTVEGLDLLSLPPGTRLQIGRGVILEITQIGKECHTGCAIFRQVGKCIMPREGVFARVISGGEVKRGDPVKVVEGGRSSS